MFVGMVHIGTFADQQSNEFSALFLRHRLSFVRSIDEHMQSGEIVLRFFQVHIDIVLDEREQSRRSFLRSARLLRAVTSVHLHR